MSSLINDLKGIATAIFLEDERAKGVSAELLKGCPTDVVARVAWEQYLQDRRNDRVTAAFLAGRDIGIKEAR